MVPILKKQAGDADMREQGGKQREITWSQQPANLAIRFAPGSVRDPISKINV